MTREILVTCEDGTQFMHPLEDGDSLKVTGSGNLRLVCPHGQDDLAPLESPVVSLRELVEYKP